MERCRVDTKGFSGCDPAIGARIQAWMTERGVRSVELRPVPGHRYYAIYLNGLPEPVPGVVLAAEDLEDPEVLLATLEAARVVFDHETAKAD